MPLHLLFADDYTSYANDAAFEAAYPFDAPTDPSTSATVVTWGATNGPGGVPGILGDPGFTGHGSGQYDKFPLDPQGRLFRLKLRTSFPSGYVGVFLRSSWAPSGTRNSDSAGSLVSVSRTGTSLVVNVETTNADSNSSPLRTYTQTIASALPDDTVRDIQIDGQPSVISGTAGSYAPDESGFVTVSVDGVQVFSFTGAVWFRRTDINPTWNMVTVAPRNSVTNLEIYDEVADVTIVGSTVFGTKGTVQSTRTFLANLDDTARTVNLPGTFVIGGDLVVMGNVTATAPETLFNSIVTTGSEVILDSSGNIVFVSGA